MCRFPLFTDSDVMAHDGRSIKPSLRTLLSVRADEAADAAAVAAAVVRPAAAATVGAVAPAAAVPAPAGRRRGRRRGRAGEAGSSDDDGASAAYSVGVGAAGGGARGAPSKAEATKGGRRRRGRQASSSKSSSEEGADSGGASPARRRGSEDSAGGAADGAGGRGGGSDDDDDDDDDDDEDCDGEGGDLFASLPVAGAGGGREAAPRPVRPKFADGATVIDTGEGLAEVAVGRWHTTASGRAVRAHDDGVCRMFLVDRQGWMDGVSQAEPEGALLCPGCRTKVGLYSLGGLRCSCGLAVAPGFKVPKARVDAMLHGINTLDIALAAASMDERGAELGGLAALARPGEDAGDAGGGDGDGDAPQERKKGMTSMPVSKHRGNFSQFRNQVT